MDWFQIGKEVQQGYMLSPCLFNFYAEYIMWNVGQYESQVKSGSWLQEEISTTSCKMNTTVLAEGKEELKSLLVRVKEKCEKAGL